MTLALSLGFYHRYDLGTGILQFCLGQHMSASSELLKARVDQHRVIVGVSRSLTLSDAAYLTAPDWVSLPDTLDMAYSTHIRLWVVLDTLIGRDHPVAHGMDSFNKSIMERDTYLEEYSSWDKGMKPNLPTLLTQWVHIFLS